jgi:mono/diheme cytochrome c family protein
MSVLLAVLAASLLTAGCGEQGAKPETKTKMAAGSPPAAAANQASVAAEAKEVFNTRCAPCHGTSGKGDGPGAIALTPKPRNYTDGAWQKAVTDDQLRKTIVMGGAAVGKSPIMPASPDLESKPEVVDGLVKTIRAFAPQ